MRFVILAMNLVFGVALAYLGFIAQRAIAWEGVVIGAAFLANVVYQIATWPKNPASDPDDRDPTV